MAINRELLVQTLAQVLLHPEQHDQAWWRRINCNTTMCFGGWACQLAGGQWATVGNLTDTLIATDDDLKRNVYTFEGVRVVDASTRAQRVLGLTEEQADELFQFSKDRDELIATVLDLLDHDVAERALEADGTPPA